MKIKEVEQKTGITKANIRYYESQGLISPNRETNGYRTYSEFHVNELLRIKLLRTLGLSIESIKALNERRTTLQEELFNRKCRFDGQYRELEQSEKIIDIMLESASTYDELKPEEYLALISEQETISIRNDVDPKPILPWRRMWARSLDFAIYNLVLYVCFPALFQIDGINIPLILADMILLVTIEPLLLSMFYTTPGKLIFGMTVTTLDGKRLTYREALDRTLLVLQHGLGFYAPFLKEYMQYNSLSIAENGGTLVWEQNSELNIADAKLWRYLVFIPAFIVTMVYPFNYEFQQFTSGIDPVYQGDTPFFNIYQIEDVEYFTTETSAEEPGLIEIGNGDLRFLHENHTQSSYDTIGTFEYTPTDGDPTVGLWTMRFDDQPEKAYELRVEEDGKVTLNYYEYGTQLWSWYLSRVNTLDIGFLSKYQSNFIRCEWYGANEYDGDIESLQVERISTETNLNFIFVETAPAVLTVTEDRIQNGETVTTEITLNPQANGSYLIVVKPDDIPANTIIAYHVPYAGGEYIFAITA